MRREALKSLPSFLHMDVGSVLGLSRQLLGLDIGSSAIKLAQVRETKQGYRLQQLHIKPLKRGIVEAGLVNDADELMRVLRGFVHESRVPRGRVAMAVSGSAVMVKPIQVPQMAIEDLEEQLVWEAEQYIPYDLDEIYFDYYVLAARESLEGEAPQMTVLLVAARRDIIEERVQIIRQAGLIPCVVDVDGFAIANMYHVNYPGERGETATCTALVNIGASTMNMDIMKGGAAVFTRDVPFGGDRYTEAIQQALDCSFEEAESTKRRGGDFTDVVEIGALHQEVSGEISKTLGYFKAAAAETEMEVGAIYLCGGGSIMQGLQHAVSERTGLRVMMANPLARIQTPILSEGDSSSPAVAPLLGVVIGLALRKVGDR